MNLRTKGISPETIKKVISHTLTFFLGLLAYYGTERISDYLDRPIIVGEIDSIIIRQDQKNDWESVAKLRIANSGNSETSVRFTNVQLYFPEYSARPFHLRAEKFIKIPARSNSDVEMITTFPSVFDSVSTEEVPTLAKVDIEYEIIDRKGLLYISKDSSNIVYKLSVGSEHHGPEFLKDAIINSSENLVKLVTRNFVINYKGTDYINKLYPKDANVEYKIENGKIYIQYSMAKSKVKLGAPSQLFEPFILIPHPELKDKIVYPEDYGFGISVEKREKDRIVYENYKIEMGKKLRQIIYIFK